MVYQKLRRRCEPLYRSQPNCAIGMSALRHLGDEKSVGTSGHVQGMNEARMTNHEAREQFASSFHDEMGDKPFARECGDSFQRPGFFEEVRRAWNNLQLHFAAHSIACLLV